MIKNKILDSKNGIWIMISKFLRGKRKRVNCYFSITMGSIRTSLLTLTISGDAVLDGRSQIAV